MNKFIFPFIAVVLLAACGKDKFKSEPQVNIKSLTPDVVNNDAIFTLTAEITDKEGDPQDTVLLVSKRFDDATLLSVDTLPFSLKNFGFPDRQTLEIKANFSYGEVREGYIFQNLETADRQLAIGIIVKDLAGNRSEYVESDKILLKKF